MIIVIASVKGGAGKSSICQTLAVYLIQKYKSKSVKIVDADPQKTTAEWNQARLDNTGLVNIPCSEQSGAMHEELLEYNEQYNFVLVDTGGSDSKGMRSALAVADLVVVPCRPKRRDLKAVFQIAESIELTQMYNKEMRVASIVTQAPTLPSQAKRIMKAKDVLSAANLNPLRHITCMRNAWDDSDENGCTVLEVEDEKASDEAKSVFKELMGEIDA